MATVVEFIKNGPIDWTVPAGVTSIRVDLIGPGGGSTSSTGGRAGGGGGGAIGVVFAVTPGETFHALLTTSTSTANGYTNFSSATADRTVTAFGGFPAPTSSSTTGGQGGNTSYEGPEPLYSNSGGRGGTGGSTGGGGGGGAAGPNGGGGVGGAGNATSRNSGGGGGANGGTAGAAGPSSSTGFAPGGVGASGGGDGGRGDNQATGLGAPGLPGSIWTSTATGEIAGPGGGAGGNRNTATPSQGAKPGGQYGGGAGGSGSSPPGVPGDGLIVVTYTITTTVVAGPAALSVVASSANLLRGFTLPAAKSAFVAVGVAAGIKRSRMFSVSPGAVRALGNSAGLLAGHVLPAGGAQLSTSAGDGTLRAARRFDASVVALALAGGSAILTRIGRRALDARPLALSVNGVAAALRRSRELVAGSGAFIWDGVAALLGVQKPFTPAPPERTLAVRAQRRFVLATRQVRLIRISKDNRMLIWPAKHVGEVLDYALDWTDRLDGDAIVESHAEVIADNVTVTADRFDGAVQTVWLSGLKAGPCSVLLTVKTASQRTFQEAVRLIVAP